MAFERKNGEDETLPATFAGTSPDATAWLPAMLLIYGTALHAVHEGQISGLKPVYDEVKSFFASPFFFILLGALFLYCALVLLDETHSSYVFIPTVLGLAMILFDTPRRVASSP